MSTTTSTPTLAARLRGRRSTLLVGGGLVAAVLVAILLGGNAVRTSTPLDPDNPDPGGAQALARVLADQGVDVSVVRSADALHEADTSAGTTVLVTSTDQLGASTTRRLLEDTSDARLVLAAPGPGTTRALGITDLPFEVTVPTPRPSGCADPAYDGLSLQVDHALEYPTRDGCFGGEHGFLVVEPREGVVLLGAAEALTNDQVLRADNAAAVLRLLGRDGHLVWYVPNVDDLVGDDGVSLATLLPRWVRPGVWLGGAAMIALVLWRGRRFGALATEPLPVVVKAIETTRSRGRLYRKAG
ncbi:MAG: secreted protein, partial [Nocardioides sp.]|nr:secreted protein [Nocardioides sp.]